MNKSPLSPYIHFAPVAPLAGPVSFTLTQRGFDKLFWRIESTLGFVKSEWHEIKTLSYSDEPVSTELEVGDRFVVADRQEFPTCVAFSFDARPPEG